MIDGNSLCVCYCHCHPRKIAVGGWRCDDAAQMVLVYERLFVDRCPNARVVQQDLRLFLCLKDLFFTIYNIVARFVPIAWPEQNVPKRWYVSWYNPQNVPKKESVCAKCATSQCAKCAILTHFGVKSGRISYQMYHKMYQFLVHFWPPNLRRIRRKSSFFEVIVENVPFVPFFWKF